MATKPKLVIWGASGHALVVGDIIRLTRKYQLTGFLDDVELSRRGVCFCGSRVLGGREQLEKLMDSGVTHIIVGFGDCAARMKAADHASNKGYLLATAIHPSASVATDAVVGSGTVIAAGAVVNPGAIVGENVIVNTCASVDHECTVGAGSHIGPGARLAGRVIVGTAVWIGIGAVVKEGVKIGSGAIVGAGAVVLQDIPEGMIAYGVPAKVVRKVSSTYE